MSDESYFPFLHETNQTFKNWSCFFLFFLKKDNNFMKGVQIENNFRTKRKSSIFKKMIFKEVNEISIGNLHSLFFVVGTDEGCFYKFIWLYDKTGNANSSFWCILKTTNLKIRMSN